MNYSGYGFIGFALLFGMIFCIFSSRNIEQQEFKNTLDIKQLDIYKSIVDFRLQLWLQGLALGLVIALLVCYFAHSHFNTFGGALLFTAVLLFVNYMYYTLYPKPAWMLDFIRDKRQVKEWLDLYKFMKNRYHWGLLFGVIAFFFIGMCGFDYKENASL